MGQECRILFVCTGNTCRSIMAQKLFEKMWPEFGVSSQKMHAASAGLHAIKGDRISQQAEDVLREEGIDASTHRSRPVNRDEISRAHLVFTMTENHRQELLRRFPDVEDKVKVISEFAGWEGDIHDPFGTGLENYRKTAGEIKLVLYRMMQQLCKKKGNDKA